MVECDIHETAKDKKGKRRFVIMRDQTKDEKRYDQAIVSKFKKVKMQDQAVVTLAIEQLSDFRFFEYYVIMK